MGDWEDWQLEQRRHALESLIRGYAEIDDLSTRQRIKLRRYQREMAYLIAEIESRKVPIDQPMQLVLDFS